MKYKLRDITYYEKISPEKFRIFKLAIKETYLGVPPKLLAYPTGNRAGSMTHL